MKQGMKARPTLFHMTLLAALLLFHGICNYLWLKANTVPPVDDMAFHLTGALRILDASDGVLSILWNAKDFAVHGFYPPLFHAVMAVFNHVLDRSAASAIMANMPFMAVLLLSLYALCAQLGKPRAGVLAGFIALMYPAQFVLSRTPLVEFALAAMLALSVCLLQRSEGFSKRGFSVLFGLSLGLGMLTKQVFVLFIAAPLGFAAVSLLVKKKLFERNALVNAALALAVGGTITAAWYVPVMGKLLPRYLEQAYEAPKALGVAPVFSFQSLAAYASFFADIQLSLFFFIVFLAGLALCFAGRDHREAKLSWLVSIVVPYILFTAIRVKHDKTTAPYLIFAALLSAYGILSVRPAALRRTIVGLVVGVSLVQYSLVSFFPRPVQRAVRSAHLEWLFYFKHQEGFLQVNLRPLQADFRLHDIFARIMQEHRNAGNATVAVPNFGMRRGTKRFHALAANGQAFVHYAAEHALPVSVLSLEKIERAGKLPEFVVTNYPVDMYTDVRRLCYRLVTVFTLSDGSDVFLYRVLW